MIYIKKFIFVFLNFILVLCLIIPSAYAENDYWPYSTNTYSYTDSELDYLAITIDCEARGESMKGKVAVGNVIMNRVFVYNSNIASIVTAANQFAYSAQRTASAESYEAARRVLDNEEWVVPQNCYYFKTTPPPSGGSSTWSGKSSDPIKYWGKLGNHHFYVRELKGRYNGNDVPAPMFSREYDSPRLGIKPSDEVIYIQQLLVQCGFSIKPDGYFGDATHKAVKKFQEQSKLHIDGIVGEQTFSALIAAVNDNAAAVISNNVDEPPVHAKRLLEKLNSKKLLKESIDNQVINSVTDFKINNISNKLRNDFDISIDIIDYDTQSEKHYLTSAE